MATYSVVKPSLTKSDFQTAINNCKLTPKAGMCPTILKQAAAAGLYTPPATAKQPTSFLGQVCTKSGTLNLRAAPTTNSTILAKLPKGATGYATPDIAGWVKFE